MENSGRNYYFIKSGKKVKKLKKNSRKIKRIKSKGFEN